MDPLNRPSRNWTCQPGRGYQLDCADLGVRFDLTRVRRDRQETIGLLTVRVFFRGVPTFGDSILQSADFNCSSRRTRAEWGNDLAARTGTKEIDWRALLEELCVRALDGEETADPELVLTSLPLPKDEAVELSAAGLPLLRRHPVLWFGDGGCGKSYLALYACLDLAQRGERILYCDWEFAGEEHRRRLERLLGPGAALSTLFYLRCERSLTREVERLRDIIGRQRISFLVCDSVGFATDVPPETAEAATGYFKALRQLGPLGSLHLAHVSKAEQGDQKPFGSVFWSNGARGLWYVKRTDADVSATVTVGLYHRKSNIGRLRPAIGMRLLFTDDSTTIVPAAVTDHAELAGKLPLRERLAGLLSRGAMSTESLAELLEVPQDSVRKAILRCPDRFVRMTDGKVGIKARYGES